MGPLSLKVHQHQVFFITGAAGAGKSTLLDLIAGDIVPDSGKIYDFRGPEDFSARVYQNFELFEHLKVKEHLKSCYDKRIHASYEDFQDTLREVMKHLGLYDRKDLKVKELNSGSKQKLATLQALLGRPKILLADEPTSYLDKASSLQLFELVQYYHKKFGMAVIWATHDRELVKRFNGQLIHLEKGKIVYTGQACFI